MLTAFFIAFTGRRILNRVLFFLYCTLEKIMNNANAEICACTPDFLCKAGHFISVHCVVQGSKTFYNSVGI